MLWKCFIWGQIPWMTRGGGQNESAGHWEKGRPFQDRGCRGSRATWCACSPRVHTLHACFDLCDCTLSKQRCPQADSWSNSKQHHLDLGKKRIGFKENLFSIKHLLQYCPRMFVFEVLLQITWCWESKGTQVTWYTDDKVFNFNVVANVCGFLVRKVAFSARPDSFSIVVHQKDHPRLYPFLSFSNWF